MAVQTVLQTRSLVSVPTPRQGSPDAVLDEAVDRIAELTRRLRQVGSVHAPRRTRLTGRPRCAACGAPSPCPTLLAAGLARPA